MREAVFQIPAKAGTTLRALAGFKSGAMRGFQNGCCEAASPTSARLIQTGGKAAMTGSGEESPRSLRSEAERLRSREANLRAAFDGFTR